MRKWRRRGPDDCADHSSRPKTPKTLPWKATEAERAIVCAVREATRFPLDDLTFALRHFLPHLTRDSVYRILKAERLHRLADLPPRYADERPRRGQGHFRTYDLGFVHVDVKHLPKLHVGGGEFRKRYLFVAIDRRSRFVHLAVKDDNTERSALAFLDEAVAALPFRIRYLLTDRGSCFTADAFEARCLMLGIAHRKTRPYSPQTNGMVASGDPERFNGRIGQGLCHVNVGEAFTGRAEATRSGDAHVLCTVRQSADPPRRAKWSRAPASWRGTPPRRGGDGRAGTGSPRG